MELPETGMMNFFNKVLITLSDLTPNHEPCSLESLIKLCQSVAHGGMLADYENIIKYCRHCGFLSIKNKEVTLSSLGIKFLAANRERYFEVNDSQKQVLAERVIFKGIWSNHARELFDYFVVNTTNSHYELSRIETLLPSNLEKTVHFFKYLGILQENDNIIFVDNKFSQLVYELTADSKAISEQQLEQILMENRKLGTRAENAIVEFEKQRLLKLGKKVQSALVRRISRINTAAGYDVESFDGTSDAVFPNRFIEVKATTQEDIRFYWTINERNAAKQKKSKYWIYVLTGFKEGESHKIQPITIQNPDAVLSNHKSFLIEVNKFLITKIAEIDLEEQNLKELKWFVLN